MSYKITFEVIDGDHARRRIWSNHWFTDDAMEFTKRALGRLGITRMEQLDQPPPSGIVCDVRVALREDDDGTKRNRVVTFDVVGIETPRSNPFAPSSSLSPVTAGGGNSGDGAVDVAIGDDNEDDDFEGPKLDQFLGPDPKRSAPATAPSPSSTPRSVPTVTPTVTPTIVTAPATKSSPIPAPKPATATAPKPATTPATAPATVTSTKPAIEPIPLDSDSRSSTAKPVAKPATEASPTTRPSPAVVTTSVTATAPARSPRPSPHP